MRWYDSCIFPLIGQAQTINGKRIRLIQVNNSIGCISCRKKVVPNKDNQLIPS